MNLRTREARDNALASFESGIDFDFASDEDASANSELDDDAGVEFFLSTPEEDESDDDVSDRDSIEDEEEQDILRTKQNRAKSIYSPARITSDSVEHNSESRETLPPNSSLLSSTRTKRQRSNSRSRNRGRDTHHHRKKKAKRSHKNDDDEHDIVAIVEDALGVFGLTINSVASSGTMGEEVLSTARHIETAIATLSSEQKREFARALPQTSPTTFVGARYAKRASKMGPKDPDSVLNREEERKDGSYVRLSKIKHMRAQHVHYIHNLCNQYMSVLQTMVDFALSSSNNNNNNKNNSGHAENANESEKFARLVALCNLLTDVTTVVESWPDASATLLSDTDALEAHVNAASKELSCVTLLSSQKRFHTLVETISALLRLKKVAQDAKVASASTPSVHCSAVLASSISQLSVGDASVAIRVEIAFLMHDIACTGVWDRFRTMYGGPKARFKDEYMMMMRHGMDQRVQDALGRVFTPVNGGKVQFAQQLRDFAKVEHVQSFSRYVENNFKQKVSFHVCDLIEDVRHLRNKREMATMMWDTVMSSGSGSATHRPQSERRPDDRDKSAHTMLMMGDAPPSPERRRRRRTKKVADKSHLEQAQYEKSIYDAFFEPFDMDKLYASAFVVDVDDRRNENDERLRNGNDVQSLYPM